MCSLRDFQGSFGLGTFLTFFLFFFPFLTLYSDLRKRRDARATLSGCRVHSMSDKTREVVRIEA